MRLAKAILLGMLTLTASTVAFAGGPRWYTGWPYYTAPAGQPVVFATPTPLYYTDAGALNANVTHAQADAMVAAAAAVWNVSTASLTLAQGGVLAEHVSSDNVYWSGTQLVWPDDVKAANAALKPIAVVYDTDGSVLDTLLGPGASAPSGCRQNAVVESVDGLMPTGKIQHALLILNGRCVGANPDQMLQMQYQLARAFGRVLGVGWSQLNDNVFTGTPAATAGQMAAWPLMHPIDVVCGPYTYKCMQDPFTLRTDDLSVLAQLYPVTAANVTTGKSISADGAIAVQGFLWFPTGQGLDMVNVVVQRQQAFRAKDAAPVVSAVTGAMRQQYVANPVTGAAAGIAQSSGKAGPEWSAYFVMARLPITGTVGWDTLYYSTEAINPLYVGEYAVGPYIGAPVAMSGPAVAFVDGLEMAGAKPNMSVTASAAAATCNPGSDGVESAPVAADASGWWSGQLCADGHTSWGAQTVKAGRTWTLEVTALDESLTPSASKARPLIGVWKSTDRTGTLPTVALTATPFNGESVGMTQLAVDAASAATTVRFAIADARGRGRPDFLYKARLLYADSVSPMQVGAAGGTITIAGKGFRSGNRVLVNGIAAVVVSWTPTAIVATAPTMAAARMTAAGFADVAVVDAATGGSTVMQEALSYGGYSPDSVTLLTAPGQLETGIVSSVAFAVRVRSGDGVTPAAGAGVRFAVTSGSAVLNACGASVCVLTTDANGVAQTLVTATAAGVVALSAAEVSGDASVTATVSVVDPVRVVTGDGAVQYIAAGAAAQWTTHLAATQDGAGAAGQTVLWNAGAGLSFASSTSVTDAAGNASLMVSTAGMDAEASASVQGCVWTTVCARALTVVGVSASEWTLSVVSGAGQSMPAVSTLTPVVLRVTDTAGHAVQRASVTIYQTVTAWEGVCTSGRCAASPILARQQTSATTDAEGLVSVTPLEVSGVASVVSLAASSGTQGFVTLSLVKTP